MHLSSFNALVIVNNPGMNKLVPLSFQYYASLSFPVCEMCI